MPDPPPAPAPVPPPPAKRRRGRPRKDGKNMREAETMIGNAVHGVIEGCFDAGYLISVTIGTDSSATPYRGVVFHPTKTVPVTPSNDQAPPQQQEQEPVCVTNDTMQLHPSKLMILGSNSGCYLGQRVVDKQSLRMVEEDDVMQVFEVSSETLAGDDGKQDTKFQGDLQEIMARSTFETKQQQVPVIDLHQNPFVSHGIATEPHTTSDHFQNGCNLNLGHDYSIKRGDQQSFATENPLFLTTTTFMEEDYIDFREKPGSSPPNNTIMDTDDIRLGLQCGTDRNHENIGSEAETTTTP